MYSIIAQQRLERITQFVSEMTLIDSVQPAVRTSDQMNQNFDSPIGESSYDWTASAIPVSSVLGFTAAAAGLVSDNEVHSLSFKQSEPQSPESASASEASDFSQARELDRDTRKSLQFLDGYTSETSGSRSDSFERMSGSYGNCQTSPEGGTFQCSFSRMLERIGSSESLSRL